MKGLFVTGTGTEVGKTVVAAMMARMYEEAAHDVAVFKPVVTGLDDYAASGSEPDHEVLRRAAGSNQSDDEIAPYRYGPPLSPHLAAELAGETIDPGRLRDAATAAAKDADLIICEGVGGFLVPLAPDYLVRDFARDLGLPVTIVAASGLGTINHTLLTIEAVRGAGLQLTSVVLNFWPAVPGDLERSNLETIARLGACEVTPLPRLKPGSEDLWPALVPSR